MAKQRKHEPLYTLNIFPVYDDATKQERIIFLVQTVRIFIHFRYEIVLQDSVENNEIHLKILGLHVPSILLPQQGPAVGRREYELFEGSYKLIVTKQDGALNEFEINFQRNTVTMVSQPKNPFILVSIAPAPLQ